MRRVTSTRGRMKQISTREEPYIECFLEKNFFYEDLRLKFLKFEIGLLPPYV